MTFNSNPCWNYKKKHLLLFNISILKEHAQMASHQLKLFKDPSSEGFFIFQILDAFYIFFIL